MLRSSGASSADGPAVTARARRAVDGWIYVFRFQLSFSANAYRKRTAAKVCVSGAAYGVIRRAAFSIYWSEIIVTFLIFFFFLPVFVFLFPVSLSSFFHFET